MTGRIFKPWQLPIRWAVCLVVLALLTAACGSSADDAADSTNDPDAVPTCEQVLNAPPGTFTETCSYVSTPNLINSIGESPCGDTSAWVFDLEDNAGTWFGIEGQEWQELAAEQYSTEFVESECL